MLWPILLCLVAAVLLSFALGWLAAGLARRRGAGDVDRAASAAPVATVTHELRTPITGVVGMTDLLLSTELTPEQTTYIRAIRGSAETMQAIVGDLLDAAAIEAGQFRRAQENFSPSRLVEEIVELLAPHAQAKGLELAGHAAPDLPDMVEGDAQRLRQILVNLVGNAVKYTSRGGVGLRADPTPDGIVFAVHDTGPGIPGNDITRLFGRFERGADTQETGTGLGLSIARHLAERLGGALALHSEVGRGSTFTVTLPFDITRGAPPSDAWMQGTPVLIAALSPFEGPWLGERLGAAGANVVLASTFDLARAAMAETRWPVVVVDAGMRRQAAELLDGAAAQGARILHLITPAERRVLGTPGEYLMRPVRAQSLRELMSRPAVLAQRDTLAAIAAPAGSAPGRRALLAEDDGVNALLARTCLERAGWNVTTVGDGAEAVEAFRTACDDARFDLVVLDLEMPGKSGFEAAGAIRALEATRRLAHVPIVVVTAADLLPLQATAHAHGVDAVLPKPLDLDALKRVLADRSLQRAG